MELEKAQIEAFLTALAHMRIRPQMYFSNDVPAVQNWLYGFEAACALFDLHIWDNTSKLWEERGWSNSARHPIEKMVKQGLSEDEIAIEVFTVLILAIQRKYQFGEEVVAKFHQEMRKNVEKTLQDIIDQIREPKMRISEAVARATKESAEKMLKKLDFIEKDAGYETGD